MRLSEAIRLGAMLRPQAFGQFFEEGRSCALGAAFEASGIPVPIAPVFMPSELWQRWQMSASHTCPVCAVCAAEPAQPALDRVRGFLRRAFYRALYIAPPRGPFVRRAIHTVRRYDICSLVSHLNDDHLWTRERIADFVATVEAAETPTAEPTTSDGRGTTDVGQPVLATGHRDPA